MVAPSITGTPEPPGNTDPVTDKQSRESSVSPPQAFGARRWLVPDGYLPRGTTEGFESHEAVCVLNTGGEDAELEITIYLEDTPPVGPFAVTVPAQRTRHVRTDHLETPDGRRVPHEVPYAVLVTSTVPVSVQHSRMDTRSRSMALMTTAAIAAD